MQEITEGNARIEELADPLAVISAELTHGGLELEHRLLVEYADFSEQVLEK